MLQVLAKDILQLVEVEQVDLQVIELAHFASGIPLGVLRQTGEEGRHATKECLIFWRKIRRKGKFCRVALRISQGLEDLVLKAISDLKLKYQAD